MSKNDIQVFHTPPELAGRTLVSALREWLPAQSWNQLRRLISSRRVQLQGNLCLDEGRKLSAGEVVRVLPHGQAPPPRAEDVRIRYCDAHVVVVEKPAGMTTMRHSEELDWPDRRKDRQPTLDEVLPRILAKKVQTAGSGRPNRGKMPRVRAVHRLDRDTSGLLVFARSPEAERHLVHQFRKHTIHRRYIAVVHGDLEEAQTLSSRLVRDRGDGRRGSTKNPTLGQLAVTHVKPLERLGPYTIVECRLETGRTHQIRIHLSEHGHFVCGDKVYCQPLYRKPLPDLSGAPRLALHAAELGFQHPVSGEQIQFKMPLPEDLREFLDRLRQSVRGAKRDS